MPLCFLGDENLPGRFFRAVQRHNARGLPPLDLVRVGEPPDLPLGSVDPTILLWIETNGRILVTLDERSIPLHLINHLQSGRHVPGIFSVDPRATMAEVIEFLVLAAHASEPAEWLDHIRYVP